MNLFMSKIRVGFVILTLLIFVGFGCDTGAKTISGLDVVPRWATLIVKVNVSELSKVGKPTDYLEQNDELVKISDVLVKAGVDIDKDIKERW